MRFPGVLLASTAAVLLLGAIGLAAPAAQADSVWYQSVARASATDPCPADSFGTPWQSNWDPAERSWRPSWAQWPNGGTGGFTCDRQITWARTLYPSAGCVLYVDGSGSYYANFGGGWSIGIGPRYTDAACTTLLVWGSGRTDPIDLSFVYAPPGWSAVDLCWTAFGLGPANIRAAGPNGVFMCRPAPV